MEKIATDCKYSNRVIIKDIPLFRITRRYKKIACARNGGFLFEAMVFISLCGCVCVCTSVMLPFFTVN